MDYDCALNLIRDQRLDLAEGLKEIQIKLIETVMNLHLSTYQDLSAVIENYRSLEANVVSMMACLDNLEEDMIEISR